MAAPAAPFLLLTFWFNANNVFALPLCVMRECSYNYDDLYYFREFMISLGEIDDFIIEKECTRRKINI